ncbi:uncharacterized protein LOC132601283 [Lycium barbarum]|uniref:uncharacterized protein LOC132601283 n=1 Tax=Lycium barbarum TaxID=112863 RepID=UPI00293F4258|nr:uncharacterized protein LOC132601283 [Lycium barbarum]
MEAAISNKNGKIWVFVDATVQWEVIMDEDQQITLKIHHQDIEKDIIATFVYAKCDEEERLVLWDNLYQLANSMNLPWMVGGDFNVILSDEEKLGGLLVTLVECEDFAYCVNSCDLFDMGFKGSPYTWWNGRAAEDCIFKRLDRIVVNFLFQEILPHIEVEHLTRTGYTYGEIFKQLSIREEVVRVKEQLFEEDPSIINKIVLQKAQTELKKYLNIEEQYWRQKAGFSWFTEGDRNTNFFHNHVNGKRKKLQLKRIQDCNGVWLDSIDQISEEAVNFFTKQFTQEGDTVDYELLQHVLSMVTHEQNIALCSYPSKNEVKRAVFALGGDSASGPDGFTGLFYQQCGI